MKPTPQINSTKSTLRRDSLADNAQQNFPLTDYDFQSAVEKSGTSNAIAGHAHGVRELRTFRKVSREFFGTEANISYVAEAIFFICLCGVAAWPMGVMMHMLLRWMI
jgi:hypothetical protein